MNGRSPVLPSLRATRGWLWALGFVVVWPASAWGYLWLPSNLNTLVIESDAIVIAEREGTRSVARSQGRAVTLTRYRIRKVLSGALLAGEALELEDSYPRDGDPFGWDRETPTVKFDDEVVLFLAQSDDTSFALRGMPDEDRPRFEIVHSGLRLISAGNVYGFTQTMNPGPIVPTPLYRPADRRGEPRRPLTLEAYEESIRDAIRRVETLRHARHVTGVTRRRELLLGTLDEYRQEARGREGARHAFIDAQDAFLQGIVDLFVESGDIEGALEVFAIWPWGGVRLPLDRARSAAADANLEPRLRLAAIQTLSWASFRAVDTIRGLETLLDDSVDEVREAAADRLQDLHRGYVARSQLATAELDAIWERVAAKLEETQP